MDRPVSFTGMAYDDYAALLETTTAELAGDSESKYGDGQSTWDIDRLLTQAQEDERHRVEAQLREINEQLHDRSTLHEELTQELERELERYEERLQQLIAQFASQDRKARQKARIRDLIQELQQERRQDWRDRQELLAERRDLCRELDELTEELVPKPD